MESNQKLYKEEVKKIDFKLINHALGIIRKTQFSIYRFFSQLEEVPVL